MPVLRLTKRAIDNLKPGDKPFVAFDASLPGFGVKVMPSGTKSFVLEYRPHGGGRGIAKRRLSIARYGAATVEQARSAALDALARIRLGADPAAEKADRRAAVTVSGLIDAFMVEHVATKCKPSTCKNHKVALERLREAYGPMKAEALSRAQLAAMHGRMRDCPFAANRFLGVVSTMFSWADSRGFVSEGHVNPTSRIGKYREHRRERFLNTEELARLGDTLRLAEMEGLPWCIDETKPGAKHAPRTENRRRVIDPFAVAAIRLLILTGARLREILHAKREYIDFERSILFLPDSKTGRKPVYLSGAALAILAGLPRPEGNPHIIAGMKDGAPRVDIKKPWAAITKAAGLEGLRLHDLRHSFASIGAGASLGLPIIGKLLGHTHAATTHRYAHLDADPLRRAVETIDATIAAAMGDEAKGAVVPMPAKRAG
jgi:integrase